MELRALLFETAAETASVGPIKETLRWGEPAYLTAPGIGSALRLAWKPRAPERVGLFVICSTDLLDRYRSFDLTGLELEGDRGLLIPIDGDLPKDALRRCMREALTYHIAKKAARRRSTAAGQ